MSAFLIIPSFSMQLISFSIPGFVLPLLHMYEHRMMLYHQTSNAPQPGDITIFHLIS